MLRDGERGRSSVFPSAVDPSTFEELERSEGDKRVCLHFLAGGRAEVGFLLLLCCHGACGDVNGEFVLQRHLLCDLCVFGVQRFQHRQMGCCAGSEYMDVREHCVARP
ncbi:hypothetical protein TcCL_Unassigned02057 [Trypanosoma cruzi]|nr:hypothetical protein TcCL_Unassigned02057 [Trypanosoma cruzi]